MFDVLFGYWRKASKCKRLVKTVQCRLKLLKNKRNCVVRQLREDVAELIKHGHYHTAFGRVGQIIMDQNMVEVYDLLHQFCEFVIINIPYIRKHRDCPNDINEAASTLIFTSSRLGKLPELMSIRELFGERYGQRFVTVALELLQGNLVNHQIKQALEMKKICDDVKYRLLDEIASSSYQSGSLLLEYKPVLQEEQELNGSSEVEIHDRSEARGRITYVEFSSQNNKISEEMDKFKVSPTNDISEMESCSETSTELREEIIYLDDIEEFVSPVREDQRLFVFKPFGTTPLNEETDYRMFDISLEKDKPVSRKKRSRRRSQSQENQKNVPLDTEWEAYYGESNEMSPDNRHKPHYRMEGKRRDHIGKKCSSERTCYLRASRAMTMPAERPKQTITDNILRSNSFPFERPNNGYSCRHIHPKLPDYDELTAVFMALKREKLQNKQQASNM